MNDLTKAGSTAVQTAAAATPADLVRYALENGADIEKLERLFELQSKWEANEARKAFVSAMAEFKRNPPEIVKDKAVKYSGTSYTHATIGNVVQQVTAGLAKHGFSHRWATKQVQGGQIEVTCIITHSMGHSEETVLSSSADKSGGKNEIQAIASAVTYLERYTLLAAVGLATKDQDDDGQSAELSDAEKSMADKWISVAQNVTTKEEFSEEWKKALADLDGKNFRTAHAMIHTAFSTIRKGLK